jgi:soluble lytic murein transglycosylase-like protein
VNKVLPVHVVLRQLMQVVGGLFVLGVLPGLAALGSAAPLAISPQIEFPETFSQEAPRVRSSLEKAYVTIQSGEALGGPRLAYFEFCEAARMGSAEGHYRAGLAALKLDAIEAQGALFHFRAAEELGHVRAIEAIVQHASVLRGQLLRNPPDCLVAPPDLIALRASVPDKALPGLDFALYSQRLPKDRKTVLELVEKMARESVLEVSFVMAIAAAESNFNTKARSPKNAMGVMQLIPATAERFGVKDPYDAHQNIRGGIRYLEWLHRRFKGDLKLVAAAYNSGEGAVDRHKGVPPYTETQLYVQKVLRYTSRVQNTGK